MATNFSPCKGSYVLNQFPSNVMFGMNGFHVSASGAIQGHHGPLVLNSDGLLRCRGRLEHSSLSESARFPILLPRQDKLTELIIEKLHKENCHSDVSQTLSKARYTYWIPYGCASVCSMIRSCRVCRRYEGGPYIMPQMAALPKSRVQESPPFYRTGLDYFGPLFIKSNEDIRKAWVCLFTCMVTRAVHMELIQDMTTEEFLLGFKGFVSQRGASCEIVSDNATQFKAASKMIERAWKRIISCEEIHTYSSTTGITWKFIIELAPWMGGFYERLIGIVKRSSRKTVGRRLLSLIQLQTVIKEIESVGV